MFILKQTQGWVKGETPSQHTSIPTFPDHPSKEMIDTTDVVSHNFTISASILVKASQLQPFMAQQITQERRISWLRCRWSSQQLPPLWLIAGDFNLIYKASDKNNLNLNRRLMGKFRAALDECELLEIPLQNIKFTWSSKRECPTLVKLDRVFCNAQWDVLFPNFALNALSTGGSDHCSILLHHQQSTVKGADFRFENLWTKINGFSEVVQRSWEKPQVGSVHTILRKKKLLETAKEMRA
jgi:hypothetical protein